MRRFSILLALFAALSVGLVPVADTAAKVEAALADASAHDRHSGHACHADECADHAAEPHPAHCPACAAMPAALNLPARAAATGLPAAETATPLVPAVPDMDVPPPRRLHA